VAADLRAFDAWFEERRWPSAPCPQCKLGDLHPTSDSIVLESTADSIRHGDHPNWEPEWIFGFFHGALYCARPVCREIVIVSGQFRVEMGSDGNYQNEIRLRYAIPALPLAIPPPNTPPAVVAGLEEASRVVWTDPLSAANGLRRCVEALLDHEKVPKTQLTKQRKRKHLATHVRIGVLKVKQPLVATSLEAVKWVGNQGSHGSSSLTSSDCVESAQYLDHALRVLYDTTDAELVKKARAINKAKGVKRSRKK